MRALGDVPGANMNLALLAASGIQAVSLWLLAQQGSQWATLQALVFGWAVARGSKTTQACAAHPAVPSSHGSGQILVSCLSTANFREAQASSSEEKGEKKGAWGQITSKSQGYRKRMIGFVHFTEPLVGTGDAERYL